jgi:IKI3 family
VWTAEGTLEHVGDAAADESEGLLPLVAWQPNGRNIYCVQQVGHSTRVCLFERNGLGHGSFEVAKQPDANITRLAWSPDSTLLATTVASQVRKQPDKHCNSALRLRECRHIKLAAQSVTRLALMRNTEVPLLHIMYKPGAAGRI